MTDIEEHVLEVRSTLRKSWQAIHENPDRDDILVNIYNHFALQHNDILEAIDECSVELDWGEIADLVFLRYDCFDLLTTIQRLFQRIRYD